MNFGTFLEPDMVGYIGPYMEPLISPSTNMEAAFGRLHNSGGASGARPTAVESTLVDGEIGGSIYAQYILPFLAPKIEPEFIILPEGFLNNFGYRA